MADLDPSTDIDRHRPGEHAVAPLFRHRWSARAMSGEPVSEAELMTLFEAARWAPSCYNRQPWRFLYARRDTPHWPVFLDLLIEFNQGWAENAGALLVVASQRVSPDDGAPWPTHSFDTGAAWMSLALQGSMLGLVVHGMLGFDAPRARIALNVPPALHLEAMVAIGRPGPVERLPEKLRAREVPSGRKPLSELVREGGFA